MKTNTLLYLFILLAISFNGIGQTSLEDMDKKLKAESKSLDSLRKIMEFRDKMAQSDFDEADTLYKSKDYGKAIIFCTKSLFWNPNSADTYSLRGRAKSKLLDYSGALLDFNKTIEINPNKYYYLSRTTTKFMLKDYNGAIEDCNKILELDSTMVPPLYWRGISKILLQQKISGCQDLQMAREKGLPAADPAIKKFCDLP
jgi:tetratricopeptide (TPR) repeat protein